MIEACDDEQLELAAKIFRALAEPARLKTLINLATSERAVSELAQLEDEKIGTVSARLKILHTARLVRRRREGQTIYYALADAHVLNLIRNAVEHALEDHTPTFDTEKGTAMADHEHLTPAEHPHEHGPDCGHTAVKHNDHVDYLHNGHLHHPHEDHTDVHVIEVSDKNPDECAPLGKDAGHDHAHVHGPDCGHEAVPHGDHTDYLVDGRLHHPHGDHCDDHGPLEVVSK